MIDNFHNSFWMKKIMSISIFVPYNRLHDRLIRSSSILFCFVCLFATSLPFSSLPINNRLWYLTVIEIYFYHSNLTQKTLPKLLPNAGSSRFTSCDQWKTGWENNLQTVSSSKRPSCSRTPGSTILYKVNFHKLETFTSKKKYIINFTKIITKF
jgi:hypothetical protein